MNDSTLDKRIKEILLNPVLWETTMKNYDPIGLSYWKKNVVSYRCRLDSKRVAPHDRLNHYAQFHYKSLDEQINQGSE